MTLSWEPRYARRAERMRASEIRELLKLLDKPGIISFAGGIPDPVLFPVELASRAYTDILTNPASAASGLQYSVSEGFLPLREWIVAHMGRLGVPCSVDNIVVTSGSQQGLEFLGKLLLTAGDTALVTAPTYLGALQAFSAYEPRYDTLHPEDGGNRTAPSYTEAAAKAGGAVKFLYAVPDFANPTGETFSLAARQRLIGLARELDVPLIEDTAYSALRFEGTALPCIQAIDVAETGDINKSHTVYAGTFSKTLTPGLRIGWICAAEAIVRRIVLIKQASDLNCAAINQMVMHRLAVSTYDAQVAKATALYRGRRDAMLAALAKHMPKGVTWTKPEGGLFIWVTLPAGTDSAKLMTRAVEEESVAFVPGGAFFADGTGRNTMRLAYSAASEDKITEGIARLGRLVSSVVTPA